MHHIQATKTKVIGNRYNRYALFKDYLVDFRWDQKLIEKNKRCLAAAAAAASSGEKAIPLIFFLYLQNFDSL